MSDNEIENKSENTQPQKPKSEIKTYVIYFIAIIALSYAITYGMRIYSYNKGFKAYEKQLNVPTAQEKWAPIAGAELTDFGTFSMVKPSDDLQLLTLLPNGDLMFAFTDFAMQIGQPTSAALIAMQIEKAKQENPEVEALNKMSLHGFQWHKETALIKKLGYFDFIGLGDEVARNDYLAKINQKASMPVNAQGVVVFETDNVNGILHRGTEPAGEKNQVSAIVKIWDKQQDVIQVITINVPFDKLDSSLDKIQPVLASISYDGKTVGSLQEQFKACGEMVVKMPEFKAVKINVKQPEQAPVMQQGPVEQPEPAGQAQ